MADMGQPVVDGGVALVQGGYGGPGVMLAAFKARTGDLTWRGGGPYGCGETLVGPQIVLVTLCQHAAGPPGMQRVVRALELSTGRVLWTQEAVAAGSGSGAVILIVQAPTGDFNLRGLDPLSGNPLWDAKVAVTNIPPLVNGQVALVQQYGCPTETNPNDVSARNCSGPGQARSFVSRIDPATGSQLWQAGFGQGGQVHRLLLGDVAVFSANVELPPTPGQPPPQGPAQGSIGALDLATGAELWRQSVTSVSSIPLLAAPGTVYLEQITPSSARNQCPSTRLDALESKSGVLRWRLDNLQVCETTADSDGKTVVVVLMSFSGSKVLVLDAATGTELWEKSYATSGPYPLVHASVSGGTVYVAASGHFPIPLPVAGD
jgi:outer membrane protein assembly factor BamB